MKLMLSVVLAAALIAAALFGSELVGEFVSDPENAQRLRILIGLVGLVIAAVSLRVALRKKPSERSHSITINGGVRQSGQGNSMNIANEMNAGRAESARSKPKNSGSE